MANLSKVVKIRKSDYESLITNGSVVINETTHTYDPLAAYIIVDPLIDAVQGVKVNGTDLAIDQNGAVDVLLALSSGYTKSSALTKDTLSLHSGLTYEESFGNLEQIIAINEEVTARSLVELKDNVNNIVIPVASNSNPLMDGSVSVGTSNAYARGDHRHPRDTSRAPIASPTFTGTPKAPTASSGVSNTQIATTAFVHNVLNGTNPTLSDQYTPSSGVNRELVLVSGDTYETAFGKIEKSVVDNEEITATALADLDSRINSLEDKPDVSVKINGTTYTPGGESVIDLGSNYAKTTSPSFTGTPKAPTAASGTSTTQIATTAFVHSVLSGMPSDVMWVNFSADTNIACDTSVSDIVTALNDGKCVLGVMLAFGLWIFIPTIFSTDTYGSDIVQFTTLINDAENATIISLSGEIENGADKWEFTQIETVTSITVNNGSALTPSGGNINIDIPRSNLSNQYTPSSGINEELALVSGDTYETAFGKIEKVIVDNEEVVTMALTDLDSRVNSLEESTPSSSMGTIKVNGTALTPDSGGTIDISVPTALSALTDDSTHRSVTDIEKTNWDNAYSSAHTHSNKSALDAITATKTANWDKAYSSAHTHSNKSALDTITTTKTANWDNAYSSAHTHSNKSALDTITATKTANWDNAYSSAHTHSNKAVLDDITSANITAWNGVSGKTDESTFNAHLNSQLHLPSVTSSDNNKILMVVNGQWALVTPTTIYSGTGTPDSAQGNNGDLYLQTT